MSIKSFFMKLVFVLCALSKSDVSSKNSPVGSKLPTLLCWPREKRAEERKVRSKPALRLKRLRYHMIVPHTIKAKCSSPFEALNLIVVRMSKSLPV